MRRLVLCVVVVLAGSGTAWALPGVSFHDGNAWLGGSSLFEIGGDMPGNGEMFYSQFNVTGNLTLLENSILEVAPYGEFLPQDGVFTILTWEGELIGIASVEFDPWYANNAVEFDGNRCAVPRLTANVKSTYEKTSLIHIYTFAYLYFFSWYSNIFISFRY